MAYVFRLVLLLLLAVVGQAHAGIPVQPNYTYTTGTWNCSSNCFASLGAGEYIGLQAACDRGAARMLVELPSFAAVTVTSCVPPATNPTVGNVAVNSFGLTVQYTCKPGSGCTTGTNSVALWERNTGSACPANSTSAGGACTCNTGFAEDASHTSCVVPDPCAALAGTSAGVPTWSGGASTYSFCDSYNAIGNGKCVALAEKDMGWRDKVGKEFSIGHAKYTGASGGACSGDGSPTGDPAPSTPPGPDGKPPDTPAPGSAAPSPCPPGQASSTVNGTSMCAPMGSDTPTNAPVKSSTTTDNPDGSSTTTTQSGETNCEGSKCTTQTTCQQSTKAVDGTTTNSSCGGQTVSQSLGDACKSGAASTAQCSGEGGSSFSGDCAAGFHPTGDDAVLNAMALEQYTRNCQVLNMTSPEATVIANASDPTGLQKATTAGDATVSVGPGNFDTSDALGGGGCSLDKTFTVEGRSVTLPFSKLCDPLAVFGQLLVVVSLLLAARIVSRG